MSPMKQLPRVCRVRLSNLWYMRAALRKYLPGHHCIPLIPRYPTTVNCILLLHDAFCRY
jgi:hypothetical protein